MKTGTIYRIYHIESGKSYVGQTISPINSYIRQKFLYCKNSTKLYNAIQKHGKSAFTWEILHADVPVAMLDNLESQHIRLWRCLTNGYNLLSGGQTNKQHSHDTKAKMSKSRRGSKNHFWGKTHTPEARDKMSKNNSMKRLEVRAKNSESQRGKMAGKNNPFWGKHHTIETRKKISDAKKGKPNPQMTELNKHQKGPKHPMWGKKHTAESRKKMSDAKKGKYTGENHPNHHTNRDKRRGQLSLF